VRDVAGDRGYSFSGPTINSGSSGLAHDLRIPSGWDTATRQVSGTRHAAPFAVLDTVYKIVTTLTSAGFAGPLEFPELTLDWAATNAGDSTFYSREGGGATRR